MTRLKYIAQLNAGGTPDVGNSSYWASSGEGVPWVSIGDMSSQPVVQTTSRALTAAGLCAARLKPSPPGTILFSMYASLGHTARLGRIGAWNQAILGITPTHRVDPRFLEYCLSSLRKALPSLARSNTQQNLNAEQVGNLELPLPPLDEQRRIADFLDSEVARIDRLAKAQQEMLLRLHERDLAVLDSKIDEVAGTFGTTPFRRFIASVEQGFSPQCDNMPAEDHEWGVLKVSSVKRGVFHPSENKRLPDEVAPVSRYEVREGDLLVTRANTPALVGAAAVVGSVRRKLLLCDKIFRIGTTSALDKNYLAMVAQGTRIRDLCAAASHGTSQSMANLKIEEVKEWPVPAAPLAAQRLMLAEVFAHHRPTSNLRTVVERQLGLLSERRQALIAAAVSGAMDLTTAREADL
ncbi:restriction endonuclease subunit S [Micromonospora sp. 4G55]|nr:restriction endonuclease subunit S [Micromonospora sp. 4G55]